VDDHQTNRAVLTRQLNLLGYAAECAVNGAEALVAWRTGRFGALILDCNMPVMGGQELAGLIRDEERRAGVRRIPIIACTADALPATAAACVSAGMDDCLVKPAGLEQLGSKLSAWLPLRQPGEAVLPAVLDLDVLAGVSGGDMEIQDEVISEFHRFNAVDVDDMRDAVALGDFPRIERLAHRIKGASLMVGASGLALACASVGEACGLRDPGALAAALDMVAFEMQRLEDCVAAMPAGHRP
jgi:CheY-like chemotaxis protein